MSNPTAPADHDTIRSAVRDHYAATATGEQAGCGCGCGPDALTPDAYAEKLGYTAEQLAALPEGANLGLSCGNPLAAATLQPGQTVVDLGSGAGFDALLARQAVGENGRVIGVDMTPEMLEKARANAATAGVTNVEFRLGEIEALPLADKSVDVIISNCVINLSPDKPRVIREAFRVLKPGGRLAISDVVATGELSVEVRSDLEAISACIGGAARVESWQEMLAATGFTDVSITPKDESKELVTGWTGGDGAPVISAIIEATRPAGGCC